MKEVMRKAAKSAGIQKVIFRAAKGRKKHLNTPDSFRYDYAYHRKKVDPSTLQRLMGHKSVATTMTFYTVASDEELVETTAVAPDPG